MKEITKTIIQEFNDKGNLIKKTETTIEKEVIETIKQEPIPYWPGTTPLQPYVWPNTITCGTDFVVSNSADVRAVATEILTAAREMGCK